MGEERVGSWFFGGSYNIYPFVLQTEIFAAFPISILLTDYAPFPNKSPTCQLFLVFDWWNIRT